MQMTRVQEHCQLIRDNYIRYIYITMFSKKLHNLQNNLFTIVITLSWILYISILLGLSTSAPNYLSDLQYYTKMYVSLFLILRFNPFRKVKFTELDGKIAFSAGLFLLGTTAINSIVLRHLGDVGRVAEVIALVN
jgi:hypothetical protein